MFKRIILVIIDGLGDRPIEEFAGLTPLEFAETPNMDKFAKSSECGIVYPLGRGKRPGSDIAHMAILGYDTDKYYTGRGPIEAAGLGIELKEGDVALRGNLASVDSDLMIKDRRAGRSSGSAPFVKELDGLEIEGVHFFVKPGSDHRVSIVMHGKNLSGALSNSDPLETNKPVQTVFPTDNSEDAKFTAAVLNRFLSTAHEILHGLKLNEFLIREGKLPANYLVTRWAGRFNGVPSFKEQHGLTASCIAGAWLYKGIAKYLGMRVLNIPGATGMANTDLEMKFKIAMGQLETQDFVFIHIKAADSLGKDGNPQGKKAFIEKVDHAMKLFRRLPDDVLLVITADHSTPCELRAHSADPVPIMFCGKGVRSGKLDAFSERTCANGTLGAIDGKDIMPHILNLMGRLPLIGS